MDSLWWTSRRHWREQVNNTLIAFHLSETNGSCRSRTWMAHLTDRDANHSAISPPLNVGLSDSLRDSDAVTTLHLTPSNNIACQFSRRIKKLLKTKSIFYSSILALPMWMLDESNWNTNTMLFLAVWKRVYCRNNSVDLRYNLINIWILGITVVWFNLEPEYSGLIIEAKW